jgi:hypothetical protein
MPDRVFTVEEANALIPRFEIILSQLQQHSRALRDVISDLSDASGTVPDDLTTEQLLTLRPEVRPVATAMEGLLRDIEATGAHFKGLALGLVDFPAEVDGETILLCWQHGEKEIGYYHTLDSGFAARKPLHVAFAHVRSLQ